MLSVFAVPLPDVAVAGKLPVGTSAGSEPAVTPLHAADCALLSDGCAARDAGALLDSRRELTAGVLLAPVAAGAVARRGTEPANTAGVESAAGCAAAGAVRAAGRRVRCASARGARTVALVPRRRLG